MKAKIKLKKEKRTIEIILSETQLTVHFPSELEAAIFYKQTKAFFKEKGYRSPPMGTSLQEKEKNKGTITSRILGHRICND